MDNQPKIRPEWVPEAYKELDTQEKQPVEHVIKVEVKKAGFKRATPRKINPGGGKAASTGGLDRKRGRT
jgi:hypothetical protein